MADLNFHLRQSVRPNLIQRTVLLGRVKMAQAIHLRESEWARALSDVEGDSLFQELMTAQVGSDRIVRYKRYGRTNLAGQFYEMQDANVVGGGNESPETLLSRKRDLLKLIEKVGQPNFEKFFLYREESVALEELAKRTSVSLEEARKLQEFVMEMSVQSEFYHPSGLQPHNLVKPTLVGKIIKNEDGGFTISYFSPHLARGIYEINSEALKRWQKEKKLDRTQSAKLRRFLGLLELSNLKQGAFWRVTEYLLQIQKEYFETQDPSKLAPVSLRHIARTLQFAPSTISRVMGSKSILLPWDHEIMLTALMPGQRRVVLSIIEKLIPLDSARLTDSALAQKIQSTFGIKISRRTVTACRHALLRQQRA